MHDLICDVINYCASNFATGICKCKNLYDEIVINNLKRRRDGYQTNFYMNFDFKRRFTD